MAFVELCRLHANGRGGWEGIVDGHKRGHDWMVPDGAKLTLWTLGSEKIDAFLLDAVEPEHVGAGQDREWEGAQLLCRVWRRKIKKGYYGKMHAGMTPKNRWAWDLPGGLVFSVFDDRDRNKGFVVKIDEIGVSTPRR